jgi:hypothetical protein
VRPLLILRLYDAPVTVGVEGSAAWLIPWVDLAEGVGALTVVAIAHAGIGCGSTTRPRCPSPT